MREREQKNGLDKPGASRLGPEAPDTRGLVRLVERLFGNGHMADSVERTVARVLVELGGQPRDLAALVRATALGAGGGHRASLRKMHAYARAQARLHRIEAFDQDPYYSEYATTRGIQSEVSPRGRVRDTPLFERMQAVAQPTAAACFAHREALVPPARGAERAVRVRHQVVYATGQIVTAPRTTVAPHVAPGVYAVQADRGRVVAGRGPRVRDVLERLGRGTSLPPAVIARVAPLIPGAPRPGTLEAVRVHVGHAADALCNELEANAFAVGRHVVIRSGKYQPDTAEGLALLAHELTHVWQQARGLADGGGMVADAGLEREAQTVADRVRATWPATHDALMMKARGALGGDPPPALFVVSDKIVGYDRHLRAIGAWAISGTVPHPPGTWLDGGVAVETWSKLSEARVDELAGRQGDLWLVGTGAGSEAAAGPTGSTPR